MDCIGVFLNGFYWCFLVDFIGVFLPVDLIGVFLPVDFIGVFLWILLMFFCGFY